jgi:hypothetical protein
MTRAIRTPLASRGRNSCLDSFVEHRLRAGSSGAQAKFDAKVKDLERCSTDPQLVSAVKSYNGSTPSAEAKTMTNDQWADPFQFSRPVRTGIAESGQAEMAAQLRTLVGQFKIKPAAPVADNVQTALI